MQGSRWNTGMEMNERMGRHDLRGGGARQKGRNVK